MQSETVTRWLYPALCLTRGGGAGLNYWICIRRRINYPSLRFQLPAVPSLPLESPPESWWSDRPSNQLSKKRPTAKSESAYMRRPNSRRHRRHPSSCFVCVCCVSAADPGLVGRLRDLLSHRIGMIQILVWGMTQPSLCVYIKPLMTFQILHTPERSLISQPLQHGTSTSCRFSPPRLESSY